MYQNIYNYFFEYDLSKTPGFTYVLANFLGVIIYTAFNPRRRKNIWAYAELLILGLMYLVYNFFTRDISTVLSKYYDSIYVYCSYDLCSMRYEPPECNLLCSARIYIRRTCRGTWMAACMLCI